MAEQKNPMPPRRPGGPGHGPRSHGYQRPQDLRGTVKKLLHYVGRYKGLLVLVAVCLLLSSVGSVASSYFLKPAINDYILPGDFAGLLKLLVLMGLVFVLSALCSYVYSRIMVRVSQRTVAALRQDLFDKLQELPLRYFDTHQSGDLMSRFTNDIDTVSEMINNSFANVLSNSLTFLCTIGMLLYLNWALTLITFAFLGLMLLVVKVIGGRSRVSFQRQQAALGDLNGYIEEMIEGQKVIKVFHHEQQAIDQFSARNDTYQTAATMAQTYAGSMMPATANLSRINYAVTCCVGGLLAMGGVFDIGSLGAYLLYVKQVSQPVSQISQQVNTILAAIAGAERIFAVMEAQPEEDQGQTTIVRVEKNGDTLTEVPQRTGHWAWKKPDGSLTELRGDVRFDHVTFGYDPDKAVLHDISLFAEPGQKIAFVGSTGAGKTTITNLINRFYDIQQGTITYDGIDVREIRKNSLRKSLGVVLQDTHLFTGTIADNIRYGKLDATDEQVRAAAKLGFLYGAAIMAVGVLLFWLIPGRLLGIFNASDYMLEIGIPALRLISLSFLPAAFGIVTSSVCQALGHGVLSLIVSVLRQLVLILPVSWLLGHFVGLSAVWAAFPFAEVFSFLLSAVFMGYMFKTVVRPLEQPEP